MKKETADLLSRIIELRDQLSDGEKRVADLILSDLESAVHGSISDLASRAKVSLPTVTRFCRTVGCAGVRDLKISLASGLSSSKRYLQYRLARKDTRGAAGAIVGGIHSALETLMAQLDFDAVARAAVKISRADKVLIFGGGGGSSAIAQDAEYRLFRLGVHAVCCNDAQLQHMMTAIATPRDVLLIISTGGRFAEHVKTAGIARQYRAEVIAITRPNSPLATAANLCLAVDIAEDDDIMLPTPSRFALLAVVDILAAEVAYRRAVKVRENLRRIKYQLINLDASRDELPLGD